MVNLEQLRMRGLRAYELGRLLSAARILFFLVPLTAVCMFESTGRETCACLAVLLLASAIWLRWRDRSGMESVTIGLLAGSLPLATGLLLAHFELRCGLAGADSFCSVFSLVIGAASGVLIMSRVRKWRLASFVTAAIIALLAAGLGCVRLGVVGVASMVLGVALGSVAGAVISKRSRG